MTASETSRTAAIRALAAVDRPAAERMLVGLVEDLFALKVDELSINSDQYSLNSLNGFLSASGEDFFFKFHQEEGEEGMAGEYYRAEILSNAGLPVDRPVYVSTSAGEQVLIYRRRSDPRFSDFLRALDLEDNPGRRRIAAAAERDLSGKILDVYLATLRPVTPEEVVAEPIHQLFHGRLVDARTGAFPGGRYSQYYIGQEVEIPDLKLPWSEFSRLKFEINGRRYEATLEQLFAAAAKRLNPLRLSDAGGVVAHGDAHNANVWFQEADGKASLAFFDPAFAGDRVPALMAEVKATFHNVFAHPLWLYDPEKARATFRAEATRDGEWLRVRTDWQLSPVRRDLLTVKAESLWRPLLAELEHCKMLPDDWAQVVRLGFFLAPTLVMNLRAGARTQNPVSSLIAFAVAVSAGGAPAGGAEDDMTRFLDAIDPVRQRPLQEA